MIPGEQLVFSPCWNPKEHFLISVKESTTAVNRVDEFINKSEDNRAKLDPPTSMWGMMFFLQQLRQSKQSSTNRPIGQLDVENHTLRLSWEMILDCVKRIIKIYLHKPL